MPRTPYSDEEVATRRNAILDAAMELHDDGGVAALSFRNIAARLGFSYATPYRYFASKEALLTALRARVFRWMEGILMDAVERAPDPMRKLEALAGAYVRAGIDKPSRYALMFFRNDELSREPRSLELVAAKRDALDVCTRVVAAAQEAGVLRLSVDPLTGNLMELDAIAAVVIGGASLYGGRGTIVGTLIGVLIMVMIRNGLNLLGVSPFWQGSAIGGIIIMALLVERLVRSRSES